jgi:hypothetical protein
MRIRIVDLEVVIKANLDPVPDPDRVSVPDPDLGFQMTKKLNY